MNDMTTFIARRIIEEADKSIEAGQKKYRAYFVKTRVKLRDVIGGGVILVVLSILLIIMPESLLKNENTPYVFDNAGWYEQYIDESGAIINRSQE